MVDNSEGDFNKEAEAEDIVVKRWDVRAVDGSGGTREGSLEVRQSRRDTRASMALAFQVTCAD